MTNEPTKCPNCRKQAVSELDNLFQCMECGNWGYAPERLPYGHEQAEDYRPSGQVYRRPRAA
jgi:hypothetical protein